MPHFVVEYTDNIKETARIPELLKKAIQIQAADGYPMAGMRGRAICFTEYELADGKRDYAMVHATIKVAPGHTVEEKHRVCNATFAMMKDHFAEIISTRHFQLSLALEEVVGADGETLKFSNIHHFFEDSPKR
jgi:5-carboxymethyl-2-hydroxymuconate isomerase